MIRDILGFAAEPRGSEVGRRIVSGRGRTPRIRPAPAYFRTVTFSVELEVDPAALRTRPDTRCVPLAAPVTARGGGLRRGRRATRVPSDNEAVFLVEPVPVAFVPHHRFAVTV